MKRDSFIFYRSFMEALENLDDAQYAKVFRAISKYALDGKELRLTGVEKVIFQLVKPQLDANKKRYENGCRGGRPIENKITETKPNDNQTETKAQPNDNDNENVNVNYLKEEESREEEKSSLQGLNDSLRIFIKAYDIAIDGYNANIHNLEFDVLNKAFSESVWLRKNVKSLQKICAIYPKIKSGYYKDYVGVDDEIIIPQEEWFKVESALATIKENSSKFNPSHDNFKAHKEKQERIFDDLPSDTKAYFGNYSSFTKLLEYKTLENEQARFIRDFEKFCQKRRLKNATC